MCMYVGGGGREHINLFLYDGLNVEPLCSRLLGWESERKFRERAGRDPANVKARRYIKTYPSPARQWQHTHTEGGGYVTNV